MSITRLLRSPFVTAAQIRCLSNGKTVYSPKYIRLESTREEDVDMYLDFMLKHYVPANPVYKAVGISPEDPTLIRLMEKRIKRWVNSGASCFAVHVPNNELAAVLFSQILTRESFSLYHESQISDYSEQIQILQEISVHLENFASGFEDARVKKVLGLAVATVNPKYSGLKLLSTLLKEGEKLGKTLGCEVATGISTNFISQGVLSKLGYEVCYTLQYEDWKMDGKNPLDLTVLGESRKAQVLKKDLTK